MDYSTPGLPVLHRLPEFAQTHVHQVNDAIQTSHALLSPSPFAFNLSQHQAFSDESEMGRYGSVLQPQPLAHGCGCAPLLTPTPVTRRHLPSTISTPALLLVHACQKAPPKSNQLQ